MNKSQCVRTSTSAGILVSPAPVRANHIVKHTESTNCNRPTNRNPGTAYTITFESFIKRYNSDLANDFGNLVNRVTILIHKHFDSRIPDFGTFNEVDLELVSSAKTIPQIVRNNIEELKIQDALEKTIGLMRLINKYLETKAPWKSVKTDSSPKSDAANTLYIATDTLRISAQLLAPVMPTKIDEILKMLGGDRIDINDFSTGGLKSGTKLGEGKSPFPRIILE